MGNGTSQVRNDSAHLERHRARSDGHVTGQHPTPESSRPTRFRIVATRGKMNEGDEGGKESAPGRFVPESPATAPPATPMLTRFEALDGSVSALQLGGSSAPTDGFNLATPLQAMQHAERGGDQPTGGAARGGIPPRLDESLLVRSLGDNGDHRPQQPFAPQTTIMAPPVLLRQIQHDIHGQTNEAAFGTLVTSQESCALSPLQSLRDLPAVVSHPAVTPPSGHLSPQLTSDSPPSMPPPRRTERRRSHSFDTSLIPISAVTTDLNHHQNGDNCAQKGKEWLNSPEESQSTRLFSPLPARQQQQLPNKGPLSAKHGVRGYSQNLSTSVINVESQSSCATASRRPSYGDGISIPSELPSRPQSASSRAKRSASHTPVLSDYTFTTSSNAGTHLRVGGGDCEAWSRKSSRDSDGSRRKSSGGSTQRSLSLQLQTSLLGQPGGSRRGSTSLSEGSLVQHQTAAVSPDDFTPSPRRDAVSFPV